MHAKACVCFLQKTPWRELSLETSIRFQLESKSGCHLKYFSRYNKMEIIKYIRNYWNWFVLWLTGSNDWYTSSRYTGGQVMKFLRHNQITRTNVKHFSFSRIWFGSEISFALIIGVATFTKKSVSSDGVNGVIDFKLKCWEAGNRIWGVLTRVDIWQHFVFKVLFLSFSETRC